MKPAEGPENRILRGVDPDFSLPPTRGPRVTTPGRSPGWMRRIALSLATLACTGCGRQPAPSDPRDAAGGSPSAAENPASVESPSATAGGAEGLPATAKLSIDRAMRENLRAPRHPSDGGGQAVRVLRENEPESAVVGERRRFEFRFEVGPAGISPGGLITLQVPPFWFWSSPQTLSPAQPGFTTVRGPIGADLQAKQIDQQLLGIEVRGRGLDPGELVHIVYGDAQAGNDRGLARVDRYAEAASVFHFAVDGDGDGVRELCLNNPSIEILADRPARLILTLESTARQGDDVRLTLALLDAFGSLGSDFSGQVQLESEPSGWELPPLETFETGQPATRTLRLPAPPSGTWRVLAKAFDGSGATPFDAVRSNPLRISDAPNLVWIDLHGHSALSDGTGSPEQFFHYARDVAQLDAVALTDHDAWGLPLLSQHPELVATIDAAAQAATRPGEFLAFSGFEWTSWIHGHRHVVYFDGPLEIHSSLDESSDTPGELEEAVRGRNALIIPHHPAGGPIPVDWSFLPDPQLTPVVEICSVHGSSESSTDPQRIYSAVPGHFVRDALGAGHRYGLIGSGDSHDGHPGLPQLVAPCGGLAAVMCEELTPEALLEALRARRVYATSGERIVLRTNLAGLPMGSSIPASSLSEGGALFLEIIGTNPLTLLEVIGPEGVLAHEDLAGVPEFRGAFEVPALEAGTWLFVRILQQDRTQAWSSPFWIVEG